METLTSTEEARLLARIQINNFLIGQIEFELKNLEDDKKNLTKEEYKESLEELKIEKSEFSKQIEKDQKDLLKIEKDFEFPNITRSLKKGGQSW